MELSVLRVRSGLMYFCLLAGSALFGSTAFSKTWLIPASDQLQFDAQDALMMAAPGDTVVLPEGRFSMSEELSITTPFITLKGQGMGKTVLVYDENAAGPQAIFSSADHTRVEDLAIVNHPGDGVKMIGVDGATIRRVKVEWTRRGASDNGAYGLYPVLSRNVLLEDNLVIGASDAGVYVGQSQNIIVRRNRVEYNVAGIEIENSSEADVYDNHATQNTGGILIFNLPNLMVNNGRGTRVFRNIIYNNNFKNFAPKGNIVALVPQGTGVLVLANDEVEIFENDIDRHNTTSISIASYHVTELPIRDPKFDALPEKIYIHDNVLRNAGRWPLIGGNRLGLVAGGLSLPHRVPHITYDGIGVSDGKGGFLGAKLEGDRRICIGFNEQDGGKNAYFGNLQLWKKLWWSPVPGAIDRQLEPHDCTLEPLSEVRLAERPPAPAPDPNLPSAEDIARLCKNGDGKINWDATSVDCPQLSDYGLFAVPDQPLSDPAEGGYPYDLTTPLFSDYASKDRVLFLPPGTQASYRKHLPFEMPVGAIIAKTFYFPEDLSRPNENRRLVETRLLIHRKNGWQGLVYLWNTAGTEAFLRRGGAGVKVAWKDAMAKARSNTYKVPNQAQCVGCHLNNSPIGIKAGYLNQEGHGIIKGQNQLAFLEAKGVLAGLPASTEEIPRYPVWNQPTTGSLAERAKTYLDINCAHCHSAQGKANSSGLYLNLGQAENISYGLCKPPVAAGRGAGGTLFDIVPGKPQESILIQRMASIKAAVKMPELAKTMAHDEGVALISEWIASLQGSCSK